MQKAKEFGLDAEGIAELRETDPVRMANDTTVRYEIDNFGRRKVMITKQKGGKQLLMEDLDRFKKMRAKDPAVTMSEVTETNASGGDYVI